MRRIGFWIIMGFLFVGLIGFGATGLSGTSRTVATAGEVEVAVQDYANALNNQINAVQSQLGQALTFQQAQAFGIDQQVLGQLISTAVIDNEAETIGLSVGDDEVRQRLVAFPQFQGLGGGFDRETYRFAIENAGLTEAQFEEQLRRDAARALLQGAIIGAVAEPATYSETLIGFIGEERSISYLEVTPEDLDQTPPPATADELRSFYTNTPDLFTAPEVRRISFAWLTPEMLQDAIDVPESAARELYQMRLSDFVQPERRLVERLVMPDEAAAQAARTALDAGETDFRALVEERGLALADTDLGDVTRDDLGAAAEAVFAAETGDVVGPEPTSLGPAFFRINASLAAQETSFEEARTALEDEIAADRARRQIGEVSEGLTDLIAGGATIEDIAENTALELGSIDWSVGDNLGIAAYDSFRAAAAAAEEGAFPELVELSDGGVFVLRLDEIVPPSLRPFDDVRAEVEAAWRAQANRAAVTERAEALAEAVRSGADFAMGPGDAAADGEPRPAAVETGLLRRDFLPGTPEGFMGVIFDMAEDEVRVVPSPGGAIVVRLDDIASADMDSAAMAAERRSVAARVGEGIARDMFSAYATAIRRQTEVTINDAVIGAVNAQFQ